MAETDIKKLKLLIKKLKLLLLSDQLFKEHFFIKGFFFIFVFCFVFFFLRKKNRETNVEQKTFFFLFVKNAKRLAWWFTHIV